MCPVKESKAKGSARGRSTGSPAADDWRRPRRCTPASYQCGRSWQLCKLCKALMSHISSGNRYRLDLPWRSASRRPSGPCQAASARHGSAPAMNASPPDRPFKGQDVPSHKSPRQPQRHWLQSFSGTDDGLSADQGPMAMPMEPDSLVRQPGRHLVGVGCADQDPGAQGAFGVTDLEAI